MIFRSCWGLLCGHSLHGTLKMPHPSFLISLVLFLSVLIHLPCTYWSVHLLSDPTADMEIFSCLVPWVLNTGTRRGEDMGLGCSSARFAVAVRSAGWFSRSECIWRTWLLQPHCGCVRDDSEEPTCHVSEAFMLVCLAVFPVSSSI